ncbi:MAG: fatty acid desaturase [Spirochaetaceae bacterium]
MSETIKFYRIQVKNTILKKLNARSNLRGLIQTLSILLVYLLTTMVSLYFFIVEEWIFMFIALYIHSIFSNFLGEESSVHELSHKTPFKTKWLNESFYNLFCFLTWNNPIHFRKSHKRHHQFTLFQGKDKEAVLKPPAFNILDYISWFLFDWKKFKCLMICNLALLLGRDQTDFFSWDPHFNKDNTNRKKMINWARFQFIGHLILICLFIYLDLFVLIYTVSCSYFFVTFLSNSCVVSQHTGLGSNIPDFRLSCHTIIFNPFMAFFYWNMNYHIEHHMHASVPFYNLKNLHKELAHDMPTPVQGYGTGIKNILGYVKKQKTDPDCVYTPELPTRKES